MRVKAFAEHGSALDSQGRAVFTVISVSVLSSFGGYCGSTGCH